MTEFGFSPRTVNVTAGERVTLKLKNAGTLEHEFMVGRAPVPGRGYAEDWLRLAVPGLVVPGLVVPWLVISGLVVALGVARLVRTPRTGRGQGVTLQ